MGLPEPWPGWVDDELVAELGALRLLQARCWAEPRRRSTSSVRARMRALADRAGGAQAIHLRRQPVPAAYRVFYRHVGMDPDRRRVPVEEAMMERMLQGGYRSRGRLADALLVAVVETGVPVWALAEERLNGDLGIRAAGGGERLGREPQAPELEPGRLVVVDGDGPVAVLFGDLAPGHEPGREGSWLRLFGVAVEGVPSIHLEEALWTALELLDT